MPFMTTSDDIYGAFPALSYNSHNCNVLKSKLVHGEKGAFPFKRLKLKILY